MDEWMKLNFELIKMTQSCVMFCYVFTYICVICLGVVFRSLKDVVFRCSKSSVHGQMGLFMIFHFPSTPNKGLGRKQFRNHFHILCRKVWNVGVFLVRREYHNGHSLSAFNTLKKICIYNEITPTFGKCVAVSKGIKHFKILNVHRGQTSVQRHLTHWCCTQPVATQTLWRPRT